MKIVRKNIEIVKFISGKCGDIFTTQFENDEICEMDKFISKYEKYLKDPLFTAFQKMHTALYIMLNETGFKRNFFKEYENNLISKVKKTDELRLYGIQVSEEEILLTNGGRKMKGKRPYQSSPLLFRQVKILESLRPQLFERMKTNKVTSISELLDLGKDYAKFTIIYEDELE